ncbi:MAG: hypothetical protein ACFFFG_05915 [Candidatus Thorarchaeota archaeon]
MEPAIEDAIQYLNSAIRTYVNATKTFDKYFAIKLIVLSMIVAVDVLVTSINKTLGLEGSFTPYEDSSFFLPLAAYEQRYGELIRLEEEQLYPRELELSRRLLKALDLLKIVYGGSGLHSLLSVNLKDFINETQFFLFEIQELLDTLSKR